MGEHEHEKHKTFSIGLKQTNKQTATVKITPSDDKGRLHLNKRPMMMMKTSNIQELSSGNLERDLAVAQAANMLRAPTEDANKSRW